MGFRQSGRRARLWQVFCFFPLFQRGGPERLHTAVFGAAGPFWTKRRPFWPPPWQHGWFPLCATTCSTTFWCSTATTAHGRSASLYTVITVLKTLASALLVARLAVLLPVGTPALAAKIPVDVGLFFLNYLAQKLLVY